MICLYQYCDKCKTEKNFDPVTIKCLTCIKKKNEKNNQKDLQGTSGP